MEGNKSLIELCKEAERQMTICNACRYCEGHCPVFPAMERRFSFNESDVSFLANLCHNCGACYHHCQYAPPHEFSVNVPKTFSELRIETYKKYAWPRQLSNAFDNNGLLTAISLSLAFVLIMALASIFSGSEALTQVFNDESGGFYNIVPHNVMAALFGAAGIFVVLSLVLGIKNFWREIEKNSNAKTVTKAILPALKDALTLKHLGGGNDKGCTYPSSAPSSLRRTFHHLTFYGFMLCFAATSTGTIYHYFLDYPAPYGYLSLPKLFGITGGIGLIIGPIGLFYLKLKSDKNTSTDKTRKFDATFIGMLLLTSISGLLLMLARETSMMGWMLIIHLAIVLSLFISLPYGKFVHGFYRIAALVRDNLEKYKS